MDDFEKNFPEFDWKNTPAYKHPLGRDCPCPKHEYIREQISIAKNLIIIMYILKRLYLLCP